MFGLRRRRERGSDDFHSSEDEDGPVTIGGGGSTSNGRFLDLDMSLNPVPPRPIPATRQSSSRRNLSNDIGDGNRGSGFTRQGSGVSGFSNDGGYGFYANAEDDRPGSFSTDYSGTPPSVNLPSAKDITPEEMDKAVMLAIEASRTHNFVQKLYWVSVLLLAATFAVLVRVNFKKEWSQGSNDSFEMATAFEAVFAVLVVLTIAFRSDFPFNVSILVATVFYSGVVFGTIASRNTMASRAEAEDEY
mmetsp:Transcript_11507/g.13212  ORF Transcript_11507/g.13212 Transcript_11507/m.13212 type:complete len:246 (+) Transcript_11507:114-851(+)